jgi:large subunit ribosomal protein L24
MKNEFSTSWLSSKQPRKQRKYAYNAPLHLKHKFLSAHLSKELRKKYGKRNLPLRKGDEVLVMRGSFTDKKAKVSSIDLTRTRVSLEGIQRSKRDGTKVNLKFHPSVLMITTLFEDKQRTIALERKGNQKIISKVEKKSEKKEQNKDIKEK